MEILGSFLHYKAAKLCIKIYGGGWRLFCTRKLQNYIYAQHDVNIILMCLYNYILYIKYTILYYNNRIVLYQILNNIELNIKILQ